jgi:hypothetical protein
MLCSIEDHIISGFIIALNDNQTCLTGVYELIFHPSVTSIWTVIISMKTKKIGLHMRKCFLCIQLENDDDDDNNNNNNNNDGGSNLTHR